MRAEQVLNRQSGREKEGGSATVKPLEIPRIKNDSGGIAVTPFNEQALLADERSRETPSNGFRILRSEATGDG